MLPVNYLGEFEVTKLELPEFKATGHFVTDARSILKLRLLSFSKKEGQWVGVTFNELFATISREDRQELFNHNDIGSMENSFDMHLNILDHQGLVLISGDTSEENHLIGPGMKLVRSFIK